MTAQTWLLGVALGVAIAGSGCVSTCHQAAKASFEASPNCEVPLCDRQHVYAVLINGVTPTGLEGLRDKLATLGFAKVYCGELVHVWWFEWEMRRVFREDPSARFVLVGYDVGCPSALGMAKEAVAKGLPVDAVYLLDPVGTKLAPAGATRTVVVQSGPNCEPAPCIETVAVPDAGHFSLSTHATTVATIHAGLKISAFRVIHPTVFSIAPDGGMLLPPGTVSPTDPRLMPNRQFRDDTPGANFPPLTPVTPDGVQLPNTILPPPPPAQPLPLPSPRKARDVP